MAKRRTKNGTMIDLISQLNSIRQYQGKPFVTREWTGVGHWLKTDEDNYKSVGGIFTNDDEFIGFLRGLILASE